MKTQALNGDGYSYPEWMKAVDRAVWEHSGVSVHDLADFRSWDYWNDCRDPEEVAYEVLEEEGFPFPT